MVGILPCQYATIELAHFIHHIGNTLNISDIFMCISLDESFPRSVISVD